MKSQELMGDTDGESHTGRGHLQVPDDISVNGHIYVQLYLRSDDLTESRRDN